MAIIYKDFECFDCSIEEIEIPKYHKIDTIFKRKNVEIEEKKYKNTIIPEFTTPLFEALKDMKWSVTEKIDGTNTRIHINYYYSNSKDLGLEDHAIKIEGCTNNAEFNKNVEANLIEYLKTKEEKILNFCHKQKDNYFNKNSSKSFYSINYIIFGETFGRNVQSGGRYRKNNADFIAFDIMASDACKGMQTAKFYEEDTMRSILSEIGIDVVPYIGDFTIREVIEKLTQENTPTSLISEDTTLPIEGYVLKPKKLLYDNRGHRLITKLKVKDFIPYIGTDKLQEFLK